ncbi:MAG TPA: S53 family peptidase [Solirubrobacteraceae bacterium]|nr:S53 family peptidase [Solirubrobacteraceae bacterium]
MALQRSAVARRGPSRPSTARRPGSQVPPRPLISGPPPKLHRRRSPGAVSTTPSTTKPYWVCPRGACEAIADPQPVRRAGGFALPDGGPLLEGSGEKGGYDPADLRAAYSIPAGGGSSVTVAVIDAYGYAGAEADLAKYREHYGLAPCTKANGCFRRVNQEGKEGPYPSEESRGWIGESALDLDMVSAACPECHILLVEGSSEEPASLAAAAQSAVRLGATIVSNSYGYPEDYEGWCKSDGCAEYAPDYSHEGVLFVASAGDSGYNDHYVGLAAPNFPATAPGVVAVGGTSLHKASNARGYVEEVWNEASREVGTGSGCSEYEPKPSWQSDKGCAKRTDNDIAAVAACATPVSIYSSAYGGFENFCGTSASAPLFAGIAAHASAFSRSLYPALFYRDPSLLYDVTTGSNGTCTPPTEDEYLCHAATGYDGPSGNGAPNGVPAAPLPSVSALSPASGPASGGTTVTITGTGFTGADAVRFGERAASSFTVISDSEIQASSPAGGGTVSVSVSTPAGTSAASSASQFAYRPPSIFRNNRSVEVANGTNAADERLSLTAYGELKLEAPTLEISLECITLAYGSAWNEGEPKAGRGQVLSIFASGRLPAQSGEAPSAECQLKHGHAGKSSAAWVSAEAPLLTHSVEAQVCVNASEPLATCSEREERKVITSVARGALSLPWEGALLYKVGVPYARIGQPAGEGSCSAEPPPAGCLAIDVVDPTLGLELPLVGSLEAKVVDGVANGLSPSTLELEGATSGTLHEPGSPATLAYLSGSLRVLGFEGQELLTVR